MARRPNARVIQWPDWKQIKISAWQRNFLADRSMRKVLCAGRGAGKSFIILLDALISAIQLYAIRRTKGFARPGPLVVVGIVAPNLQNLRDLWTALKALAPKLEGNMPSGEKRYLARENKKAIWLFGESRGIEIRLMSAWIPNSMRSASIDILVLDEWAFCGYSISKQKVIEGVGKAGDEVFFTILQKLIVRAFCYGKIIVASTPLSNFFDDWCQQAMAEDGADGYFSRFSFHHASALDNEFLTEEQLKDILDERLTNEYKYLQEREGQLHVVFPKFTAKDVAFQPGLIDGILINELPGPSKGPYAVGVDVSWLGSDFLCVWVVDLTTNILVHCELHAKTALPDIIAIAHRLHDTWNPRAGRFGFDATGEGKSVVKCLPAEWDAQPVFFWDQQKPHLVRAVEMRMQQKMLLMPNHETFDFKTLPHWNVEGQDQKENFIQALKEIRDYRRREDTLPSGTKRVKYMKGDIEKRDDCVDGLSVLSHVMPAIPMDMGRPKKTKETLAEAFRQKFSGGGNGSIRGRRAA